MKFIVIFHFFIWHGDNDCKALERINLSHLVQQGKKMTTYKTDDYLLPQILEQINSGKLQLPEFQRGWIWDDQHIRDLLVSIAKSFPIGAIMLLETGGETNFSARPVDGVKFNGDTPKPETLILDGQQRLTSLTQALTSKDPVKTGNEGRKRSERYYYIDINMVLNGANLEDAIFAVDSNRQRRKNFGRDVNLDLSTFEKECEGFYFPCNQILDSDEWEENLYKYRKDRFSEFMKFRQKVLNNFRSYKIPAIVLEKETSKEAVCLVFEKVNTGGVPLTVFELITASLATEGLNLREDWYGDEDKLISGIKTRLSNEQTLVEVEPTDFFQTISLLSTLEQREQDIREGKTISAISAKRSAILSLSGEDYLKFKSDAEYGFLLLAKFLRKRCIFTSRDIPYKTQLVPFAAVLAKLKDRWLEQDVYDKLSILYCCGVFGELYGGTIETRMANDFEDFMDWLVDETKIPRTIRDAVFNKERLQTLKTRTSAAYKAIHSILLIEGAMDFYWKASIKELDFEEYQIDLHHIFPKKWCEDNFIDPAKCNSIINKTPISYKANRIIGGDAPSIYLKRIQEKSGLSEEEMNAILSSHGIDHVALRNGDFITFYKKREEYLNSTIRKHMGK